MGNVFVLETREIAAIDTDAIQAIKGSVGEKRCRTVIDGLIFAITDGLCQLERAVETQDHDGLPEVCGRLEGLCAQVGLVCMLDVLNDLAACHASEDYIAMSAVTARLIRIGEDSLYTLIEFADRSIM